MVYCRGSHFGKPRNRNCGHLMDQTEVEADMNEKVSVGWINLNPLRREMRVLIELGTYLKKQSSFRVDIFPPKPLHDFANALFLHSI